MGIQIKRVGHVGILVSDFERSFEFYTKVLGCKVTSRRRRPDGAARRPSCGLTRPTMISSSPLPPKAWTFPRTFPEGRGWCSRWPSRWKTVTSS